MKQFIDRVCQLGWKIDVENSYSGTYCFSKEGESESIISFQQDGDFLTISSSLVVPQEVEDFVKLEKMLQPFIQKEMEEHNQFGWEGERWDSIKLFEDYLATDDGTLSNWDDVEMEQVENMIDEHVAYVQRMKSVLSQLYTQLYKHQEENTLAPEQSIRIPVGRIHSAYPTLKEALDQYIHDMKVSETLEDEQEIIEEFCFWIDEIAMYNLCYRNLLRDRGVEALIQRICEDEPRLPKDMVKSRIIQKWETMGKTLPDYDVRFLGLHEKVEILGETFIGLDDFLEKESSVSVLYASLPYPCFDEYDAMYENRRYRAWAFSSEPMEDDVRQELHTLVDSSIMWDKHIGNTMHLPVVYDDGDKPVAYLITPR